MHRFVSACARLGTVLASVTLIGVLANPADAATTGKIAGQVVDQTSGTPIPGAAVTIPELHLGGTTDADGRYFIIGVPPGVYEVSAVLVGYTPVTIARVVVNIDRTTPVDFRLSSSAIKVKGVTVVAPREVIQLDVAGSRATLDAEDVVEVPAVTSLAGAINQEPNISGMSIRGGLPEETQLMVNGHSLTDDRLNTFDVSSIPLTSVQEVQILTSGFNAEYGNVRSGVINVVTRDDPRNYWVNSRLTYTPAHKPHWGSESAYGKSTKEWQIFGNDELVNYHGAQVPKSLVTPYKIENTFTPAPGDSTTVFLSWIKYIRRQHSLQDSIEVGTRLLEYWQHRHRLNENDYAKDPDIMVDASVGGPVPAIHNLSFTLSHRNTQNPYALASVRPSYTDHTEQLTLTYRLGGAAKLSFTGKYTAESGVSSNAQPIRGGYTGSAYEKYALYRLAPVDNKFFLGGLSFSHILSTNTQYELGFDLQKNEYQLGLWPLRYIRNVGVNPVLEQYTIVAAGLSQGGWRDASWMRKDTLGVAPYGHQGNPQTMPDEIDPRSGFSYDLGGATDDSDTSSYLSYKFRGALTSQLTTHHQVKTGFELQLTEFDERLNNQILETGQNHFVWYNRTPTKASGYVQDKIEYEGMVLNAGVRVDYFDPNSNVYAQDSLYSNLWEKGRLDPVKDKDIYAWFDSALTDPNSKEYQSGMYDIRPARTRTKISPRLAISHPLDAHSKVYFNYGHFYTYPPTQTMYGWRVNPSGTGISPRPNPELDLPRTIMYELAFEREFTNRIYAWLFGMKPEMQYLVRVSGFYKDVTREIGTIGYFLTLTDVATQPINKRFAQIRGFEVRIQKRVGRFATGWFQGSLSLRDQGAVGNVVQDRGGAKNIPESAYQQVSLAEPVWSLFVNLHTPRDFTVFGIPRIVAEQWSLGFSMNYQQGRQDTYNPNNDSPPPPLNVRYKDSYSSSMRLAKGFSYGKVLGEVFLDVTNILGYKTLSSLGMTGREWQDYLKSLHFPIEDLTIETDYGNDRIGDTPDYAVIPNHDSWAHYLNPRTYTLGLRFSF